MSPNFGDEPHHFQCLINDLWGPVFGNMRSTCWSWGRVQRRSHRIGLVFQRPHSTEHEKSSVPMSHRLWTFIKSWSLNGIELLKCIYNFYKTRDIRYLKCCMFMGPVWFHPSICMAAHHCPEAFSAPGRLTEATGTLRPWDEDHVPRRKIAVLR